MNDQSSAPLDMRNRLRLWLMLLIIPVGILAYILVRSQSSETVAPANDSSNLANNSNNIKNLPVFTYKDGSYTVDGNYRAPSGNETMGVSITLAGDTITDADITVKSEHPVSAKFQKTVKENFKQYVIGKKIDEVNLTKVSGSSLTPQGFINALELIKTEAKA